MTFHKPCNISNYPEIEKILNNTKNLEYIEMKDFDKCCGLNAITKFKNIKLLQKFLFKREKILNPPEQNMF